MLEFLSCAYNPWEYPLPIEIVNKFKFHNVYGKPIPRLRDWTISEEGANGMEIYFKTMNRFKSYDFQIEFIKEHPEKIKDLEPIGYAEGIKQEFPSLITGVEWGFFDLENNV